MAYSERINQKTAIERVRWFIKREDPYNAKEALKDVEDEGWVEALKKEIAKLRYE